MNKLLLFLGLLLPTLAWAQFTGGPGDGTDATMVIQLDLSGIPGGIRGLYAGGLADGYAHATGFGSFSGQSIAGLYDGGHGDGVDQAAGSVSLSGQDLTAWYQGGNGDGYSYQQASLNLSGVSTNILYGGGVGDGYDDLAIAATLDGINAQAWYGGGVGDGYDRATANGSLGAMLMLYGGGPGDGYDKEATSEALNGTSLATLFGGGPGDGSADTKFEGVVPLPLTLISFAAFPEETYVLLRWVTENEANTDFFTIEKTRNGQQFDWVGETLAAGTSLSEEQLHYELKDHEPYQGTSFYRLKTTDFDGLISYSHLVEVNYSSQGDWEFLLYPNPNTGQHFNVQTSGLKEETELMMQLFDNNGRLILSKQYRSAEQHTEQVELQRKLPAGTYLIRLIHPSKGQQSKLLIVGESGY